MAERTAEERARLITFRIPGDAKVYHQNFPDGWMPTRDYVSDLVAAALREAAEREREQCCRDICHQCAKGREPEMTKNCIGNPVWTHIGRKDGEMTWREPCRATVIRNRAAPPPRDGDRHLEKVRGANRSQT